MWKTFVSKFFSVLYVLIYVIAEINEQLKTRENHIAKIDIRHGEKAKRARVQKKKRSEENVKNLFRPRKMFASCWLEEKENSLSHNGRAKYINLKKSRR